MADPTTPPQVPNAPTIDEAQASTGIINVPALEARVTALEASLKAAYAKEAPVAKEKFEAMEAAVAAMIGHVIAGVRKETPEAKSAAEKALAWFETVKSKYFPTPKAPA